MSLDLNTLDAFSRAFARRCFAAYPDWRQYSRAVQESQPPFPLAISFMSPAGHPFYIDTCNGEVMIGFSTWHGHFTPKPETGWNECIDEALGWVDAIVQELVFAVLCYVEGQSRFGTLVFLEEDWSYLQPAEGQGTRLTSWHGTYDRNLGDVPPEDETPLV